jgi:peptidoglycan/xylan/chitin deacetylase (PgdA/CDA1 family)
MRVLNFHGVIDRSTQTSYYASLFTDVALFEQQVALLARRGRPVSLSELAASLSGGHDLPDDAVHVTFDDGHHSSLRAAEILDRYRIPWSLFVVVDAVLDRYQPWFLRLADAINASSNVMLRDGSIFDICEPSAKRKFSHVAKAEIMAAPGADQDGALERLLARPGMRTPFETAWPILDLAELKQLSDAGVEIGNHSARHRNLVTCPADDLRHEVVRSRERLEQALARPVRYFAYPDGRHDRRVRAAVGEHHSLGLATWTPKASALAVRRYEPLDLDDLRAILDAPEPWYGTRWARWTLPWRAREVAARVHKVVT